MSADRYLEREQWRQLAWITAGALAVFFTLRLLPTGTNLSHMDFRLDAKGANTIEFCDPLNPQFIPVVAVRSPVVMTVTREAVGSSGEVRGIVSLKTASGKPIASEDLIVTHTRPLHLLIVDPTLSDYQHVHPQPAKNPGEWTFVFTPRFNASYRVFADFTPAATGRSLYASAELMIAGGAEKAAPVSGRGDAGQRPALLPASVEREGYRFALTSPSDRLRAGQSIDFRFSVSREDGTEVPLQPVMDAYAHLVAFDEARSGFAHLHPVEGDLSSRSPALNFKLTIPRAGRYAIWAQVNLGGQEIFVPFWVEVM